MKILINRCFGGFGLSLKARDLLAERGFKSAIEDKKENGNHGSYVHYSQFDPSMSDLEFRMHPEVIKVWWRNWERKRQVESVRNWRSRNLILNSTFGSRIMMEWKD